MYLNVRLQGVPLSGNIYFFAVLVATAGLLVFRGMCRRSNVRKQGSRCVDISRRQNPATASNVDIISAVHILLKTLSFCAWITVDSLSMSYFAVTTTQNRGAPRQRLITHNRAEA